MCLLCMWFFGGFVGGGLCSCYSICFHCSPLFVFSCCFFLFYFCFPLYSIYCFWLFHRYRNTFLIKFRSPHCLFLKLFRHLLWSCWNNDTSHKHWLCMYNVNSLKWAMVMWLSCDINYLVGHKVLTWQYSLCVCEFRETYIASLTW